ncbi:polysaccharide biosynthesis protein [Megalodesulfovibrio gigas]|uniref:Putative polysaccharide biosynthesis protein n=1 Tax=Megalodesulfovibrio gigas (strain ATCC 19364 / DSM 1382 / NCIMB 9332 / VKM B-1759) TaxID=1121448 RepID=T2G8P3_MEGG1|nr:nucleoside-diphosphate sugar epimerase/dehydratase [Megalodesulfovibrio gigas]AGW12960.1 putative polysaccharide biosynthesis protein [Megalodesulfovibrio gigas DSM 1382 = ATCC 19364]
MRLLRLLSHRNAWLLLALDALLALAAHLLAYLTRFEGALPGAQWENFTAWAAWAVGIKLACLAAMDGYRGMWRYTSLPDVLRIAKAVTLASLAMMSFLLVTQRFEGFSRSVFLLDWLYTLLAFAGARLGIRLWKGPAMRSGLSGMTGGTGVAGTAVPVRDCVILGAGEAGEKLVRDILSSPRAGIRLAGIFDDDRTKHGKTLHGTPVLDAIDALPQWLAGRRIAAQEALIAMPSATGPAMRRIVQVCETARLPCRTIPSLRELAQGRVNVKALRDVDYRDLLPREEARPDPDSIRHAVAGKRVLVTGAGGSIGSELCRQLLAFEPTELQLLDMSESALYGIQMELAYDRQFHRHTPLLGSLADTAWTHWALQTHRPQVIFHAAAYKHVPMLEQHPWQAVINNILAMNNLLQAARDSEVESLLLVSTDKAVRPTSVMGASKRLAERLLQSHCSSAARAGMRLMAVRFGNVLGSSGSVIPLFRAQIERGGPVTVTHPEVVRYFMTVEEACLLILQAGALGRAPGGGAGEIYLLKMGRPVNIAQMAEDLIRLSGREPGRDVAVEFIGLRPGEKLYEELVTEGEGVVASAHEQLMVLKGEDCAAGSLDGLLEELAVAAATRDGGRIRELLRRGVPEYRPA